MISGALLPYLHRFFLKFKSQDTVSPAFRALPTASMESSAADSEIAGVMPVT